MMTSLTNPAVGRITLYGLGGIGKTWAARRAVDWAEQGSLFHTTIWVSLSAGSSLRQVQKMILERLPASARGDDDDDGEESQWRAGRVHAALSGSKFLLILDDLWLTEDDVLGMIGIPAHDPAVGSKVLVTTRSRRVLATTQPDLLIKVAGLPFRRSLELFLEAAREAAAESQSLQPLVHEVVHRCLGIPLAIVLLGRALRGNADAPALERTLMVASSALGQVTCNMVVYRAAKLGYRLLPNDAAREFSLKCALFNQGVVVTTQDLTRYCCSFSDGIMDGNGIPIVSDAYENGQAMLTELLNRGLLRENSDSRVVMQNVVREVMLDIGRESGKIYFRAGPAINRPPREHVWGSYGSIALMDTMMEALPESPGLGPWLSTLLLNGNHLLTTIPERFFALMLRLNVLDLSDTRIGHLPSSFRELSELRVLLLRRCVCLEEVANVDSPKLEVLDLSGATRMKRIAWGPSSPPPPSLAVLNLSETSIEELLFLAGLRSLRQLLLSGCRRLKSALHLSSLTKLEQLDLSGTTLVDFPDGISELTQLKRLRLAGSKYTRVEWRMIHWLPEGLKWDQSSGSDITIEPVQNGDGTAFISAYDPSVFWTLDRNSPLWRSCFKKFQFSVCHPDAAGDVPFQRKGFVFRDAYFKTRHFAHSERRDRHLEICGVHGFPHCIEGVLCNSELVALNNIKFMKRLSDFGLADMRGMKECWIERCDQMETVLDDQEVEFLSAEGSLACLWVSNSMSLRCLVGKMGRAGSFACLKHLNLDCCPELVCVFSSAVRLQNLETLQIKFCDGLEVVFGEPVSGEDALPRLHTMRLWELPQLKYISDGVLPDLKNLKVKQCPTLTKIPVGTSDMSPLVLIVGESWWWNNLKWDDQAIKYHLLFRKWGRF